MNKNNEERSKYLSATKSSSTTLPGQRVLEFGDNGEIRQGKCFRKISPLSFVRIRQKSRDEVRRGAAHPGIPENQS